MRTCDRVRERSGEVRTNSRRWGAWSRDEIQSALDVNENANARVIPGVNLIIAFSQLQAPDRVPFSRRADPAIEENGLGFVVSDEKEKRAVSIKCLPGWWGLLHTDNPTGCNCLGAIFIHLHKGFMDNFWQVQTGTWRDSCKVSHCFIKDIRDAHVL